MSEKNNKTPTDLDVQRHISSLYPNYPKPEQIEEFFAAMGHAIASWQFIEGSLYEIYRACTASQRPGAEACGFFSLQGFKTKLDLTSSAVRFVFMDSEDKLSEWNTLAIDAQKLSRYRNAIAHGCVWTTFSETKPDRRIYIGPDMADSRSTLKLKQPNNPPEPLTLKRVKCYNTAFRDLAKSLNQFVHRIPLPPTRP